MRRLPVLAFGLVLLGSLTPAASFAQDTRSYVYQEFDASYAVQRNATVEVEETLTYDFHGSYHQGYRSIPHAGSDSITDVRLYDGTTGQSLAYSSKTLDKTDPASWGKYTVYTQNGATNVEWYYDLADTTHTWKLSYTLHGAVSFYTSHDEFYWNIFSDLDAPVARVRATVVLPAANTEPSSRWYLADSGHEEQIQQANDRTTVFTASSIGSHAPATIALGWQKGLVSKQAYWRDWLSTRWPYLLSALIVLGTLLFCLGYWFMTERYPRIGEVIVPEYAPPRGLPPLEAELVVRESLSSRAWPATIVDLAVRGHLEITELPHKWFYFGSKYYELRQKEGGDDTLRDYEKEFLGVLFDPEYATDGVFSTLELSRSISDKREIYAAMKKLEKK
ncbi:MAG TPA: DUF2207 domain-containing protein, partial [Candidatus Paceibacterota bacterium]|nr:DUF2207 domain-containing protein [Candidatus Paceibacterota bacterium]